MSERRVTRIDPRPTLPKPYKFVGIYCRVSTSSQEQLHSLSNQISHFTRLYRYKFNWRIYDIYIDVATGAKADERSEFMRMLDDCRKHRVDTIITKSLSRFGRDTVEVLQALRSLKQSGVEIIFEAESINTSTTDSEVMITIIEGFAQAENEARQGNIRWGLKKRAADGSSGLYRRRCYGYWNNEAGNLEIVPEEEAVVRFIFETYINGSSINKIQKELQNRKILSPTGKEKWCTRSIDMLLSNEKYFGNVTLMKTISSRRIGSKRILNDRQADKYVVMANHPPIIEKEVFEAVQIEKARRSNVERTEEGTKRKAERYSSRKRLLEVWGDAKE